MYRGALVLPANAWHELRGQKDKILHLTTDEVQEAHCKGYIRKGGIWTPANKTVSKIWDALSRGRNLTSYIQLVDDRSPTSDSLLNVYLNQTTKNGRPTMQSWVANRVDTLSGAVGDNYLLDDLNGRLVGVAPEARVAREENALEARVRLALQSGTEFESHGRLYVPVDASVAKRLRK